MMPKNRRKARQQAGALPIFQKMTLCAGHGDSAQIVPAPREYKHQVGTRNHSLNGRRECWPDVDKGDRSFVGGI